MCNEHEPGFARTDPGGVISIAHGEEVARDAQVHRNSAPQPRVAMFEIPADLLRRIADA